jgi:hypothetical protein
MRSWSMPASCSSPTASSPMCRASVLRFDSPSPIHGFRCVIGAKGSLTLFGNDLELARNRQNPIPSNNARSPKGDRGPRIGVLSQPLSTSLREEWPR